jgi:hypothetical protein
MPDRYLREALLSSDRWNDQPVDAREFYIRLVLIVDDFGCFDGRPNVIAAHAFPTLLCDVRALLDALFSANMLARYSNAGKPYIALTRWQNELLGKRRWPAPPFNNMASKKPQRGKYNRPIGWANPQGADEVSVLLDAQMRPVVPQPSEWRNVARDYAPLGITDGMQPLYTDGTQGLRTNGRPVVEVQYLSTDTQEQLTEKVEQSSTNGTQSLQNTPPPTTPEERVELKNGEWAGLSVALQARWQEMLPELSIPEQLQRAAAWLSAHREEHAAIRANGGEEAFLVRWLLKEGRGTGRAKVAPDA